ncbi:MAG: hypothetical protein Q8R88_09910 [Desulfoprunum sp.]|nr:hypothetical protein [Desulfoprunum sp.]
MNTIPSLSVISRLVSTGTQTGAGPKSIATGPDLPAFTQGQTLRAVVVAENAGNQFTLETGGSRFVVESRVPLSPGQSLNLQVLSTDPKIELQITEDRGSQFLSRSLASTGSNRDLASFFTLLQQIAPSQLPNLSGSSLQTLQQFALLQQENAPGLGGSSAQQGTTGQTLSASDYGPKVLQQIFVQLGAQIENLFAQGKDQAVLASVKSAIQDVALLFQGKGQLSQAALSQLDQLAPSSKQLFEIISLFQQNNTAGQGAKDAVFNQLFQHLQLQPNLLSAANSANTLNTLNSGLAELAFLLKGPESLLQLFSTNSLQSGLLTQSQAEAILSAQGGAGGSENKGGELLQQLVNKLGLNMEGLLAAGNKEEAVKTVKFALIELVQNFAEQSKLLESGKHALNTLEFFQLTQLQAGRQNTLIVPLPLPFLEQGYLVVEDYKDQSGQDRQGREMPKNFSLFLKLSPLGNLKIDFLSSGDGVYIRFNSESKEVSDFLATFKDELDNAVSDTRVHGVSFTENGEDPLTAVLKRSRAGAESFINAKA